MERISMILPAILILAAGQSRRMRGADKLLELVAGKAQIQRVAEAALQTGCTVWVALPPDRPDRAQALSGLDLRHVLVAQAASGISASIAAGLSAIPTPGAVLILLADLPEITSDDLQQMISAHRTMPDKILRATDAAGRPGHPVLVPDWARAGFSTLTGDTGARDFLAQNSASVHKVTLPDAHATTDLDTPEDWAAWRAKSIPPTKP
jgi:molybdenum cofactor cytidylyltransferase